MSSTNKHWNYRNFSQIIADKLEYIFLKIKFSIFYYLLSRIRASMLYIGAPFFVTCVFFFCEVGMGKSLVSLFVSDFASAATFSSVFSFRSASSFSPVAVQCRCLQKWPNLLETVPKPRENCKN